MNFEENGLITENRTGIWKVNNNLLSRTLERAIILYLGADSCI